MLHRIVNPSSFSQGRKRKRSLSADSGEGSASDSDSSHSDGEKDEDEEKEEEEDDGEDGIYFKLFFFNSEMLKHFSDFSLKCFAGLFQSVVKSEGKRGRRRLHPSPAPSTSPPPYSSGASRQRCPRMRSQL